MRSYIKIILNRLFPGRYVWDHIYETGQELKWAWNSYADQSLRRCRLRLASLKGKYRGHRCFIMGNGPSLNATPLNKLSDEYVWGVNRCYLLFDRISWRPTFYSAVDTRVVPDNAEEINALFTALTTTTFFFPLKFRVERILNSAANTYWYNEISISDKCLPDGHFSTNVPRLVRSARTVTIAAMQVAVHLGFNPIYLIGCDTAYKVPKTSHFEDKDQHLIVATHDDDCNHFTSDYFGSGKKYHQPHPERMVFGYEQANRACNRLGIQIFNATVGGELEVFPRIEFESLFE